MSPAPCAEYAEARSSLVDGSLTGTRRERLLAHLVHCDGCRAEVAELRRLRAALRARGSADASDELTRRLVSIAGAQAHQPLWTRPFRRTATGTLTSRRGRLRRRATAAVLVLGTMATGAGVVGYLAAPETSVAAVDDPVDQAQAEFGSTLASLPMVGDSLAALATTRSDRLEAAAVGPLGDPATLPGTRVLDAAASRAAVLRAAAAVGKVDFSGVQVFRGESDGRTLTATLRIRAVAGRGTRTTVLDASGHQVSEAGTPAVPTARMVDDSLLALLERNYRLTGWAGASAGGRDAVLVEARRDGVLAAQWWLDEASGIVLAQRGYDGEGRLISTLGFTSLTVRPDTSPAEPLSTLFTPPATDTALTPDAAAELSAAGWVCQQRLAGLALLRLRSDRATDPGTLHLVYSDGLATISVFETRGRLADPPDGAVWDDALGAFSVTGASSLASWQSDDRVFTVVTNGSTGLLAQAVGALPHEVVPERSTFERIVTGWRTLLVGVAG